MRKSFSTIGDALNAVAISKSSKIAFAFCDEQYTWADVDRISDLIALEFLNKGVHKNNRVGIWGPNSMAWICSYFACQKIGGSRCFNQFPL